MSIPQMENNHVQLFRPCVVKGAELLALGAFFHVLGTIALYGQPIVSGPQNLGGHRPHPA